MACVLHVAFIHGPGCPFIGFIPFTRAMDLPKRPMLCNMCRYEIYLAGHCGSHRIAHGPFRAVCSALPRGA